MPTIFRTSQLATTDGTHPGQLAEIWAGQRHPSKSVYRVERMSQHFGPNSQQVERFLEQLSRLSPEQCATVKDLSFVLSEGPLETARLRGALAALLEPGPGRADALIEAEEMRSSAAGVLFETVQGRSAMELQERYVAAVDRLPHAHRLGNITERVAQATALRRSRPPSRGRDGVQAARHAAMALAARGTLDSADFTVLYWPFAKVIPLASLEG